MVFNTTISLEDYDQSSDRVTEADLRLEFVDCEIEDVLIKVKGVEVSEKSLSQGDRLALARIIESYRIDLVSHNVDYAEYLDERDAELSVEERFGV